MCSSGKSYLNFRFRKVSPKGAKPAIYPRRFEAAAGLRVVRGQRGTSRFRVQGRSQPKSSF